jgi:hypothetical protein
MSESLSKSGGLMSLVPYSYQDAYLTGNPTITFFKYPMQQYRSKYGFTYEEACVAATAFLKGKIDDNVAWFERYLVYVKNRTYELAKLLTNMDAIECDLCYSDDETDETAKKYAETAEKYAEAEKRYDEAIERFNAIKQTLFQDFTEDMIIKFYTIFDYDRLVTDVRLIKHGNYTYLEADEYNWKRVNFNKVHVNNYIGHHVEKKTNITVSRCDTESELKN